VLWFRSPSAESTYLVTCKVQAEFDAGDYRLGNDIVITTEHGNQKTIFPPTAPKSFGVLTRSPGWYPITIAPASGSVDFSFYSCEIKNV
jgi:hypothetical protein